MRNRFQTVHTVFNFMGSLFIGLGCILVLPLTVVLLSEEIPRGYSTLLAFLLPIGLAFSLGILCRVLFRTGNLSNLQAMLMCALGWLGFSAIGAIPFVIGIDASYLDGFFETMSGFTTTGITMFTGLDEMPRSILFWRSLTQWVGGLGILTFFLAVTHRSGSAHRLFGAESHKIEVGRPVPGLANTIKILWGIYAAVTFIIVLSLSGVGMPIFDSVCHGLTTLSTGGFSPHDASIGYYRLSGHAHFVWIEYILIVGMLFGATNFLVHYRILKGKWKGLYDNTEMKFWWAFISIFVIVILAERLIRVEPLTGGVLNGLEWWAHVEDQFRGVLFQVVAIITSTGFATRNIGGAFFGHVASQLFLAMMIIGGCVGSTGGGFKILRIAILVKLVRKEIYCLIAPRRAVSTMQIDGKPLDVSQIQRVSVLFFMWIVLLVFGGIITAFFSNLDGYKASSGMFSALGNIGPCYIPAQDMGQLHPIIKVTYILGMLAGRLEILPVLLLFSPRSWRA